MGFSFAEAAVGPYPLESKGPLYAHNDSRMENLSRLKQTLYPVFLSLNFGLCSFLFKNISTDKVTDIRS